MKPNINKIDRLLRSITGSILIIVSRINLTKDPLLDIVLLILGIYLIISVVINFCVFYLFLNYSSIKPLKRSRGRKKKKTNITII